MGLLGDMIKARIYGSEIRGLSGKLEGKNLDLKKTRKKQLKEYKKMPFGQRPN